MKAFKYQPVKIFFIYCINFGESCDLLRLVKEDMVNLMEQANWDLCNKPC